MKAVFGAAALVASTEATALEGGHIASKAMFQSKEECGMQTKLHFKEDAPAFIQNVPGAGVDKFDAYKTILKDGFLEVDCFKDYMYYRGDKFGDNKHDYKLGPVSNVSIVHYEDHVAKEDQVEMTQKVCFEFCRTVPNMGFFGIVNGRGCYCTPYFQAMESDSTQCDAVCEGEKTTMCGGKSKSSVFAMHMCASTSDDLKEKTGEGSALAADVNSKAKKALSLSRGLQSSGESLQKVFGAVGDSAMTGHAQAAKVFAGKLEHKAEDGQKVAGELDDLSKKGAALKGFTKPDTVTAAERIMEGVDETMAQAEIVGDDLEKLIAVAEPKAVAGAAKQYYPSMYFVDKTYDSVPSTCSGDVVAEPMVGSVDACAAACDAHIHDCVGFQYIEAGSRGEAFLQTKGAGSGCVLLSNFKTGSYYTGCGKRGPSFKATCFAKLSKFEGTTLKPDGSGKCKQCFKELTKADRCY